MSCHEVEPTKIRKHENGHSCPEQCLFLHRATLTLPLADSILSISLVSFTAWSRWYWRNVAAVQLSLFVKPCLPYHVISKFNVKSLVCERSVLRSQLQYLSTSQVIVNSCFVEQKLMHKDISTFTLHCFMLVYMLLALIRHVVVKPLALCCTTVWDVVTSLVAAHWARKGSIGVVGMQTLFNFKEHLWFFPTLSKFMLVCGIAITCADCNV